MVAYKKRTSNLRVHQNHVLRHKLAAVILNSEVFKIQEINVSEPILLATKNILKVHDNFLA